MEGFFPSNGIVNFAFMFFNARTSAFSGNAVTKTALANLSSAIKLDVKNNCLNDIHFKLVVEAVESPLSADNKEMVEEMIALAINEALEQIDAEMEAINERITGQPGGFGV